MDANFIDKIIPGSINCNILFHFKKGTEISYRNPLLIQEIRKLLEFEKEPQIFQEKDNITFGNFVYNNIAIENLSIYVDRISIQVYKESSTGEEILKKLLPKLKDQNLITIIDNRDVFKTIVRKRYNTRFNIRLDFSVAQLANSDYINILKKIKRDHMEKEKIKRIDPIICGFAVDIENSGSEDESLAVKTMLIGYRDIAEKERKIYFTVSDFSFEQHIKMLQVFNDKFAQK